MVTMWTTIFQAWSKPVCLQNFYTSTNTTITTTTQLNMQRKTRYYMKYENIEEAKSLCVYVLEYTAVFYSDDMISLIDR